MKKNLLLIFALQFVVLFSYATTWHVGPTNAYTRPSQVTALVQNGDTVLIDAGLYVDSAQWNANNLVLKGNGGKAHLRSVAATYGDKAIWVINGSNTTVEDIEFSNAVSTSANGAGIRQQGSGLTVRNCYFHDNEDGILTNADITSDILIEYCEFNNNGSGDGYSHNLYIGNVNSLTFQYCYSHHANVGHELKSRARNNYILYNRFSEETTGTASRSIDLPNGGLAVIMGNVIVKDLQSQNSNVMEFGVEGLTNPSSDLYVINNTIINNRTAGSFVQVQAGTDLCKMYNNIFAGTAGLNTLVGTPTVLDTAHNLNSLVASAGLLNAAGYDLHLVSTSPAVNAGINAGTAGSFSLTPAYQYKDTAQAVARTINGAIDIGAYELVPTFVPIVKQNLALVAFPNPCSDVLTISLPNAGSVTSVLLLSADGKKAFDVHPAKFISINTSTLADGIYHLVVRSHTGTATEIVRIQH